MNETAKMISTAIGRVAYYVSDHDRDLPTAVLWPSLFTSGHASWGPQLETLHNLGYRTILIDPPGQGASGPPPSTLSMGDCSEAALRILDAEGVEQSVFLGVSWGSFVAMKTGIVAPDRVSALVLSNTTSSPSTGLTLFQDKMGVRLIRLGVPGGRGRIVVPTLLGPRAIAADPTFAKQLTAEVNRIDRVALGRSAQSVLVEREDMTNDLHRISAPTLVISGIHDKVFAPALGESVAAAILSARYELIDGAHLAPRGDAAAIGALLKSFLGSLRNPANAKEKVSA